MNERIAVRISQLLIEKKMTQRDLAVGADLTESAVSHYIKGDRIPRGVNLIKIARALGTTADNLLDDNEAKDTNDDFNTVRTLIARNASKLKKEEKMELIKILINDD